MMQIRYPNITGATADERQRQTEAYLRYLIDQLNWVPKGSEKSAVQETKNQDNPNMSGKFNSLEQKLAENDKKISSAIQLINETGKKLDSYWETVYPVGSIYISVSGDDPETLFGGTWEQMKDRFLLSAGDTYVAGATGGEESHTLTKAEIPNYKIGFLPASVPSNHAQWNNGGIIHSNQSSSDKDDTVSDTSGKANPQWGWDINTAGGDQPHNNMPPYIVVYVWKRIA